MLNEVQKLIRNTYTVPEKYLYSKGILTTKRLSLPNFLCIGAQKAGTTWLFRNLFQHPEVYLPTRFLPHFDTHYFDKEFSRSLKWYASLFREGGNKAKGENCPAYGVMQLERIRFVQKILPHIKLILLLRNPIERAWSHALMALVLNTNRRYADVPEQEFYAHFRSERSRKRGNYPHILDNWLSTYPREQLQISFFEDLKQRPQELLKDVFQHIGVTQDVDWEIFPYEKEINKGAGIPMPAKYRTFLKEMYYKTICVLFERYGYPISEWLD